jgi:DNA repair protein RecO (recombination protein O)
MWASYLVELIDMFAPLREPSEEIFGLLMDSLSYFSRIPADKLSRIFAVKFLCFSGFSLGLRDCLICRGKDSLKFFFSPQLGGLICNECVGRTQDSSEITKGSVQALKFISENDLEKSTNLKFDRSIEEEMAKLLKSFIDYRLMRELKSEIFIQEVSKS